MIVENKSDNKISIKLNEPINLYNVEKIRKAFTAVLDEQNPLSVEIDLTSVEFVDSSGIALLNFMKRRMDKKSGIYGLYNPNKFVLDTLKISGLENYFKIFKD